MPIQRNQVLTLESCKCYFVWKKGLYKHYSGFGDEITLEYPGRLGMPSQCPDRRKAEGDRVQTHKGDSEGNVAAEVESGVMQPHVKDCPQPPETPKVKRQLLPWSLQRECELADKVSDIWSPELGENRFLLFVAICYSSPRE